jgi:thioredoxin 1
VHRLLTYLFTVYADWCGPCKTIAPHFEKLSKEYSKPKQVAFCKINVDNHSSISRTHGVTAMPTFIIFHGGQAIETIKGANPPALAAAITKAIALPPKAGGGAAFKTPGRTLGGEGVGGRGPAAAAGGPIFGFYLTDILKHVFAVLGLYFVSVLAVRWYLFGLPPGGVWEMVADWVPANPIDRLRNPSPLFAFQPGEPAPARPDTA